MDTWQVTAVLFLIYLTFFTLLFWFFSANETEKQGREQEKDSDEDYDFDDDYVEGDDSDWWSNDLY